VVIKNINMKGWITLNILVHTNETSELERLGLEIPDKMDNYSPHLVQISSIHGMSLEDMESPAAIYIGPHVTDVKESAKQIIKLIEENS